MNELNIKVQDRQGIIWEGQGDSCSMVNALGPFDILPEHTQFVTPIQERITVRTNNKIIWEKALEVSAFCRVKSNTIEIWLGI